MVQESEACAPATPLEDPSLLPANHTSAPGEKHQGICPAGGIAATHPPAKQFPILVAPSVPGRGKNTLRMELIPLACWRLNGVRFAFASSFVLPQARVEFLELSRLRRTHPGAPLSVFGHADPVGDDAFNKKLSGHRADSIYAVLTRDTSRWETLYSAGEQSEGWGVGSLQQMLGALGYDVGPTTASMNPLTKKAVRNFQSQSDLWEDGIPGPQTREKLFGAYMDFLCPDKVSKAEFLAQGADAGGKGDVQGCGEFNPVMVFSESELKKFSLPENRSIRDAENEVNRRVLVLLFRPGSSVPPAKWPCPRTSEGAEGCQRRFWSDVKGRRPSRAVRREFGQTRDTFACRFYQRLVNESPCEGAYPNPYRIEFRYRTRTGHPISDPEGFFLVLPSGTREKVHLHEGDFARKGVAEGTYQAEFCRFLECRWDPERISNGESAKMIVRVAGFEDGTEVQLRVSRRFSNVSLFNSVERIAGLHANTSWTYEQEVFSPAGGVFVFEARIRQKYAISGPLTVEPRALSTTRGMKERLKELGYYDGAMDDALDALAAAAVRRFQSEHYPLRADGNAGPLTIAALRDA